MEDPKVTCCYCGKKINRKHASMITSPKGRNMYYCPEHFHLREVKGNTDELFRNILGSYYNIPLFNKWIRPVIVKYSFAKVYNYLLDNRDWLTNIFRDKDFSSSFAAIKYMRSILINNLPIYIMTDKSLMVDKTNLYEDLTFKKPKRVIKKSLNDILGDLLDEQ